VVVASVKKKFEPACVARELARLLSERRRAI